jgi:hypothetical protein
MRPILAPVALVTALLSSPSHPPVPGAAPTSVTDSVAVQSIELYRVSLRGSAGASASQSLELVLSTDATGYHGYVISNTHSTLLDSVSVEGNTLRAGLSTSSGRAELFVNRTPDGLRGTLTVMGRALDVTGERIL